ncbi:MAG TPA: hypothetical protein VGQ96_06550, partial [Candidatus Eremiobacteraceae bacterium]|nr:hypothetical protein [Candidatus Eremiobacteraceae bacterium]
MRRRDLLTECLGALNAARTGYWRATKSFLGASSDPTRTKANLHWLLGQVLSLDVVLGPPLDTASWTAAHLAATIDTDNSNDVERAWANVSLSELALLRLADEKIQPEKQAELAEEALAHADRVVELLGRGSEHAKTTSRQFERYIAWWGNPELAEALTELGIPERAGWGGEHGLVATARRLVDRLRGQERPAPPPAPGHGRAGPAPAAPFSGVLQASPVKAKTISASSHGSAQAHNTSSLFSVEMLAAENGDCLWIEYGDPMKPRRILVDCGAKSTTRTVASRIKKIGKGATCSFELFVLTHIDADHINGVLPLFEDGKLPARFEDIWFNGWRQVSQFLSVQQGEAFSKLLEDPGRKLPWNRAFSSANPTHPASIVITSDKLLPSFSLADGMRLTLLSPGPAQLKRLGQTWSQALTELRPKKAMLGRKSPPPVQNLSTFDLEALARKPVQKDTSSANGSSIALLAEFDGRSILLTGDAHADVLAQSIKDLQRERGREGEKLKLDALKLSHHGAANATTLELLNCLDCQRFLVSSNGNIFNHPDREAIARVIVTGAVPSTLCFNYRSPLNALWD